MVCQPPTPFFFGEARCKILKKHESGSIERSITLKGPSRSEKNYPREKLFHVMKALEGLFEGSEGTFGLYFKGPNFV